MQPTMLLSKLAGQALTNAPGLTTSRLLHIHDTWCQQALPHGRKSLTLNLGSQALCSLNLCVSCLVSRSFRVNFLHHFLLSVDLNKRALVDVNTTQLTIAGVLASSSSLKPSIPPPSNPPNEFTSLLAYSLNPITMIPGQAQCHPVSPSQPKPDTWLLMISFYSAKKEFQHICLTLGSSDCPRVPGLFSTWSRDWRLCGDYRHLNKVAVHTPFLTCTASL